MFNSKSLLQTKTHSPITTKSKMKTKRCMIEVGVNDNPKVVWQDGFSWLVARCYQMFVERMDVITYLVYSSVYI